MNTSTEALPTAPVADACLRLGVALRLAPPDVRPLSRGWSIEGPALAVIHRGSVDVFFEAMTRARRGDVLVIDNGGRADEACIGDLTAIEALHFGLAGMLVWGRHRDTAELLRLDLPVFSLGACPAGPRRLEAAPPGKEQPRFGDVEVSEDDVVIADEDGVLFVPGADWEKVRRAARHILTTERGQADRVREGVSLHEQLRWDEYVRRRASDPAYDFRRHLRGLGGAIEV